MKEITKPQEEEKKPSIYQPYRITFAKWNYSAVQKKVLTAIILSLQKEIKLLLEGKQIGQLDLFSKQTDSIKLELSLNDFNSHNNQKKIKEALQSLRKIDVEIKLPAVKGKTPKEEVILTGLIERAIFEKYARNVTVFMHRATAIEMVNTAHGFTKFIPDMIMNTSSKHTQRLYEYIMHWQDQDVYRIDEKTFREDFFLTPSYRTRDIISKIIKVAQQEIKEADTPVYFEFSETKSKGQSIFNFIIKNRAEDKIMQEKLKLVIEQNKNMLKSHYTVDTAEMDTIRDIMDNAEISLIVRDKIVEVHDHIVQNRDTINSPKHYMMKSLIERFRKM